jgi:hypothetical protein
VPYCSANPVGLAVRSALHSCAALSAASSAAGSALSMHALMAFAVLLAAYVRLNSWVPISCFSVLQASLAVSAGAGTGSCAPAVPRVVSAARALPGIASSANAATMSVLRMGYAS